jgi:hypothetical protein
LSLFIDLQMEPESHKRRCGRPARDSGVDTKEGHMPDLRNAEPGKLAAPYKSSPTDAEEEA